MAAREEVLSGRGGRIAKAAQDTAILTVLDIKNSVNLLYCQASDAGWSSAGVSGLAGILRTKVVGRDSATTAIHFCLNRRPSLIVKAAWLPSAEHMFAGFVVVVVVSLVLQVAVAVLAIRLIRITESSWAWIIIAVATLAMAVRRLMVVIAVLTNPRIFDSMDRWSEAIGLLNAALLLLGIWAIGPLFRTIQQAKQAMHAPATSLRPRSTGGQPTWSAPTKPCGRNSPSGPTPRRPFAKSKTIYAACWRFVNATSG